MLKNLVKFSLALATFTSINTVGVQLANAYSSSNDIIVDKGALTAPNIAISNFSYSKGLRLPYKVEDIIANDLKYSGRFVPVRPASFPQYQGETIIPSLWLRRSISLLITGEVFPALDNGQETIALHYKLFDLSGSFCTVSTACIDKTIALPPTEVRKLGHTAANDLFQKYYNIKGDFLSKIAYVNQPLAGIEDYKLFIADYDGYNPQQILSSHTPISSPAWSPDNKKIVFSNYTTFSSIIKEYNLDTKQETVLINKLGNNSSPSYSPDGRYLAYSQSINGRSDIIIKSLASGKEINITNGRGRNTEPSWYGNSVIFTSDRSGLAAIYQANINGSDVHKISLTEGQTTNARIAKNNNLLLMINNDRITSQNLKTGEVKYISTTYLDESITVSPNGIMAIYSSSRGQNKILNILSTDGIFRATLPSTTGSLYYPAWSN